MSDPYDVALIGAGPRGLIVLQQLAVAHERRTRLNPSLPPLRVLVLDPARPGSGRVWDPDQPGALLMNGSAAATSIYPFADGAADGPQRHAAGPTLEQWAETGSAAASLPAPRDGYAARSAFGAYLEAAFERLVREANALDVTLLPDEAVSVERDGSGWRLRSQRSPLEYAARAVVLSTGHTDERPSPARLRRRAHVRAIAEPNGTVSNGAAAVGYHPATLAPLDAVKGIPAGSSVYLEGLGLGYFDAVALVTEWRGGRFERGDDGLLRYLPSGEEPRMIAGSRKGLPYLGRSRVFRPAPTRDPRLDRALRDAGARSDVVFGTDLWPVFRDVLRAAVDEASAQLEARGASPELAARTREWCALPFEEWPLASALGGFFDADTTHGRIAAFIDDQCALEALSVRSGVLIDPRQVAGAVLAPLRNRLRGIVPGLHLSGPSYRDELDAGFTPLSSFIGTGPPMLRLEQHAALVRAGLLVFSGAAEVREAPDGFRVIPEDPSAEPISVRHLVEARVPAPDADTSVSELLTGLLSSGTIARHERDGVPLHGVSVSVPHGRARSRTGEEQRGLFAFGIPTEGIYWNTVAGPISDSEHPIFTTARELAEAVLEDVALADAAIHGSPSHSGAA